MTMKQYDVYWVDLNPTIGSEVNKTGPCVIISPDEMNLYLNTIIIAPLTTTIKSYPFRIKCQLAKKEASIALDQIRTIDKVRIQKYIGRLKPPTIEEVKNIIREMLVD